MVDFDWETCSPRWHWNVLNSNEILAGESPRLEPSSYQRGPLDVANTAIVPCNASIERKPTPGLSPMLSEPYYKLDEDNNATNWAPSHSTSTQEPGVVSLGPQGLDALQKPKKAKRNEGRIAKARLPCKQCNSTFPRRYELERHQSNVHLREVSINCVVHGCKRLARPFARVDKFQEHMRNHSHAGQFVCIVALCRTGPFTHGQLQSHLESQHDLARIDQPLLNELLKALGWRRTPFSNGTARLDGFNACPLAFLGCEFSGEFFLYEHKYHSYQKYMESSAHLRSHELVERSKGYEAITVCTKWTDYGRVTCPICQKSRFITLPNDEQPKQPTEQLIQHLMEHSKKDRMLHIEEIFQILRPYYTKGLVWYGFREHFENIARELEEAGVMSPISITTDKFGNSTATERFDTPAI